MSQVNAVITWSFVGKSRRHKIEFRHNTISGKQLLTVNGEVVHKVNWKYKLTGNMYFELDGSVLELYIRADETGEIHYTLTVDNREIPLTGGRVSSTWVVALADGLHEVEFEHKSFDILVDGVKVEAVGDFVDEGSVYAFTVGTPGSGALPATLTVIPPKDRKSTMQTSLVVAGRGVAQSESLGSAEADSIAAAEGGPLILGTASGGAASGSASPGGATPALVRSGSFRIKS